MRRDGSRNSAVPGIGAAPRSLTDERRNSSYLDSRAMDSRYAPGGVEARWQETWEAEGLYAAGAGVARRRTFVICFPPPNVTGELHMGHALNGSIQDALVRWKRMQGFNCLLQPGYDHAGIATQSVVEKELEKEGLTRHDLGREAFVERRLGVARQYGRTIMAQFRRLGASMDYRRERFTMDDGYVRAVLTFFVHLWERGWLYRANRIVNWCPFHQTSLSDLELDHVEVDDELYYVRYPLADGDGRTSRSRPCGRRRSSPTSPSPCTRTTSATATLVGKEVIVPFVERRVPVIADERVEPEFGTGALKVTPGHDPPDFEIGRAHGASRADGGRLGRAHERRGRRARRAHAGRRRGARARLGARSAAWSRSASRTVTRSALRALRARGSSRSISLQWWCAMDELAQPAIEALRERPCPLPPRVAAPLRDRLARGGAGLEHLAPALVGPPAPVWYCPDGHVTVADDEPDACGECGSTELERDPDVLDTWFSSALWPFATLGWPDETPELERYYPGDLNITAREIIRLWENRMIFAGLELLGDIPFTDVIIHSTVLAPDGRRMSKSLGTGIDPLEVIASTAPTRRATAC